MGKLEYPVKIRRLFWVALILCTLGFFAVFSSEPDPSILKLEFALTGERAGNLLFEWAEPGQAQALKNISFDFVFIAGYVLLMVIVILWTMRDKETGGTWLYGRGKTLAWAALAVGAFDVVENLLMRRVVANAPPMSDAPVAVATGPVAAASVAAFLKFGLGLFVLGAWVRWVKRNRAEIFTGIKHWVIDAWSILKICRASVIVLAMGMAFLLLVPQGRDIVIALAEPPLKDRLGFLIWFFIAAAFWAFNIWYWARTLVRFDWDEPSAGDGQSGRAKHIRAHFPRLLGTLAFVAVALGFARAAADTGGDTRTGHLILAAWAALAAAFFYGATVVRRDLTNMVQRQAKKLNPWKEGLAGKVIDSLEVDSRTSGKAYAANLQKANDLERAVRLFLGLLVVLTLSMFVMFAVDPGKGEIFRSAPILLLAAAAWVPVGTLLVYLHYQFRFPLTATLIVALVIFSYTNDNHAVRTVEKPRQPVAASVAEHFPKWLAARDTSSGRYPVVVVAAEGGGIRAAYWTATVLAKIQDAIGTTKQGTFADHVYAISGVSGGSLGGAVFAALVKEQLAETRLDCPQDTAGKRSRKSWPKGPMEGCVDRMLQQDFLSPTLAAMLYPDLVQRFLFMPIARFDRGRALERSWERAWNRLPGVESGRFGAGKQGGSFDDLWRGEAKHSLRVPLLFLNSTWVETGKRVLMSPVEVKPREFADAEDFFAVQQRNIRLSSAVHNSARFTFVSPAGTVRTPDGNVWGHVVDGGYFENSGATTALELLEAMERGAGEAWRNVQPVVLMITNDPALGSEPEPRRFLKEALSPVVALLQTRGARGSYSRDALREYVIEDCATRRMARGAQLSPRLVNRCSKFFAEVDLKNVEGVPLGWVLSGVARRQMNEALPTKIEPVRAVLGR